MSEFVAITSPEQFEQAISERLESERRTFQEKYGDYDELKTKVSGYEKQIANHSEEVNQLNARIRGYESKEIKMKIAREMGLSYETIEFLNGDNEEAIRKSAETLKTLIGQTRIAPLGDPEHIQTQEGKKDAVLLQTLRNLTSKGE